MVKADNPIADLTEDRLGRAISARNFCNNILSIDPSEGLVVGVLGQWGSGKTSFINMARTILAERNISIIDFNPWMFSGTEQLVTSFFSEISSQLKIKPGLTSIGESIERYGQIISNLTWLPFVGPWIDRGHLLTKFITGLLPKEKGGISSKRDNVCNLLRTVQTPILIILDDIDRLTTEEIRDIFRLVRLTANFPNIIYLLAFDRIRVETALTEDGLPGRAYLEKILQVSYDIPIVSPSVLSTEFLTALDDSLDEIQHKGNFQEELWPDVYMEIIAPLVTNIRDVKRFIASATGTIKDLNGQIALVDVLGLEAIRIFLPDVFYELPLSVTALTKTADSGYGRARSDSEEKNQIEKLVRTAGNNSAIVHAMIKRLFMAALRHLTNNSYGVEWERTWLRDSRVAHRDILNLYLEHVSGQSLNAYNIAKQIWQQMDDAESTTSHLERIDKLLILDVIRNLENFEDEVDPSKILPGTVSLLNIMPDLPDTDGGMFSFGSDMVVSRVVYRLLKSEKSQEQVNNIVEEALPQIKTLHAKIQLIEMVGHTKGVGHKLVSEIDFNNLYKKWRQEVKSSTIENLLDEPDLLKVVLEAIGYDQTMESDYQIPDDPNITFALIKSARNESRSQSIGSRAIKKSPRMAWDALIRVYRSEETLRMRIEDAKAIMRQKDNDLFELVNQYLDGWRPDRF